MQNLLFLPAQPVPIAGSQLIGNRTLTDQARRGAACLDGSAPGYWFRAATSAAAAGRWLIHAEGGGWCYDATSCLSRSKAVGPTWEGGMGGSGTWPAATACYGSCNGHMSANASENPDLHDANAVWIGYCDGMSFASNRAEPLNGLHFRGRANLDAVIDNLLETRGLADASEVVFAGDSAGALAVWLNLDHVADRIHAAAPTARVVGFADSGVFQDYAAFNSTDHPYTEQMKNIWRIATPATNRACEAARRGGQAWRCYMAQYVAPFVMTPIFDAEAMYDAWMIPNILRLGCHWKAHAAPGSCSEAQMEAFQQWGHHANTTVAVELLRQGRERGGFVSACIHHCQSMFMCLGEGASRWTDLTISGIRLREAFGNFFFRRAGPKLLFDAVSYPGNAVCPMWDC